MSNPIKFVVAAAVLVSAAAGYAGYKVGVTAGEKSAWSEMDEKLEEQAVWFKEQYREENEAAFITNKEMLAAEKLLGSEIPQEKLEEMKDILESQKYVGYDSAPTDSDGGVQYVPKDLFQRFTNEDTHPVRDDGDEPPTAESMEPYTISEEEFNYDKSEYTKASLLFFPTDRVLCDDRDRVVEDVDTSVGEDNLDLFSPENPIVYVRNNRLEADFEITLENGSFDEFMIGASLDDRAPLVMERRGRKNAFKD